MQKYSWLLLVLVIFISLALRVYQLDQIPGEFYGDIAIVYDEVQNIFRGHPLTYFVLSNGPLYEYLISPLVFIIGSQGYITYKIASVIVSFIGLYFTYLLGSILVNKKFALISTLILSTSSWYLIFSRLGNTQIIIPALVASSLFFFINFVKTKKFLYLIIGAVTSCLGLYVMPQTFILPLLYIVSSIFYFSPKKILILLALIFILSLPFIWIVTHSESLFFSSSGYVGSKIQNSTSQPWFDKLSANILGSILMFNSKGDSGFRGSLSGLPELDPISGVFFILGFIYWFKKENRKWFHILIFYFASLQIPAILVLSEQYAIPSASRTIGILPIVSFLITGGILLLESYFQKKSFLGHFLTVGLISLIVLVNIQRYFIIYPNQLPNHNVPFGKIIAGYIDSLPSKTSVDIYSCCWGQWSQPEISGITDVMKFPKDLHFIQVNQFNCQLISPKKPTVIIWDPTRESDHPNPKDCAMSISEQKFKDDLGELVFISYHT